MHRVLEAVGAIQARVLVTLGPSLNEAEFQPPPNAIFEAFVPHSAVLPHVAAMVTQCGLGTLSKALMHGVPLVCMPLVGDQPDNAARIVSRGAGIWPRSDASVQSIRAAISNVLEQPSYREAARRVGEELARATPEITAANELESLAHGSLA